VCARARCSALRGGKHSFRALPVLNLPLSGEALRLAAELWAKPQQQVVVVTLNKDIALHLRSVKLRRFRQVQRHHRSRIRLEAENLFSAIHDESTCVNRRLLGRLSAWRG
jgi:hypothetical protein